MIKILHTADWHLGKKLQNFERLNEQIEVMNEICEIAEKNEVDAVIVAGDLYDTFNPPISAVELFYKTLRRLTNNGKRPVIAIAGNHDSPDRIEAPDPLARISGIFLLGYPHSEISTVTLESGIEITKSAPGFMEIAFPEISFPLRLFCTPYPNELRLKKDLGLENTEENLRFFLAQLWRNLVDAYAGEPGVNMLVSHLFMMKRGAEKPDEPDDERHINIGGAQTVFSDDIPSEIQYTALGHLHRLQTVDDKKGPVVYSGSPLSYSFAEADQMKYVCLVELEPEKEAKMTKIPLTSGFPLKKMTFEDINTAEKWLTENQDCFVEVSVKTDFYIPSEDRKRLTNAHPRMLGPIPIVTNTSDDKDSPRGKINLNQSLDEIFVDFYKFRNKDLEPGKDLLDLFKEIKGMKP